jgi:MYND finger
METKCANCDTCGTCSTSYVCGNYNIPSQLPKLLKCANCATLYCGKECQKAGWPQHKIVCLQDLNDTQIASNAIKILMNSDIFIGSIMQLVHLFNKDRGLECTLPKEGYDHLTHLMVNCKITEYTFAKQVTCEIRSEYADASIEDEFYGMVYEASCATRDISPITKFPKRTCAKICYDEQIGLIAQKIKDVGYVTFIVGKHMEVM